VGDIVIAEPKALIGFAGPRVIESTVRVTLPEGFQRAEFLQTKGAVDFICDRRELRSTVASSLAMLQRLPADAVVSASAPRTGSHGRSAGRSSPKSRPAPDRRRQQRHHSARDRRRPNQPQQKILHLLHQQAPHQAGDVPLALWAESAGAAA
jgi:hypothetical protein